MPILGIIASQMQGHLAPTLSYDSIATQTVGAGGAASVTFSSIPGTYKHLQIRLLARTANATTGGSSMTVRFNSDTGSNYSTHNMSVYSIGSTATTDFGATANSTAITGGIISTSGVASNIFGAGIIDLLEYSNTSIYKTTKGLSGYDNNGAGSGYCYNILSSGNWRNTNAVTSITLAGNGDWVQYSSFALYGIKG